MGRVRCSLLGAMALALAGGAFAADEFAEIGARHLQAGRCEEALDALNQGLKAGESQAYVLVGLMFVKGVCVKAAPERALPYLEPAAKAGELAAVELLVEMHGFGLGVPQSYAQAGRWSLAGQDIRQLTAAASAPAATAGAIPIDIAQAYGVLGSIVALLRQRLNYPRLDSRYVAASKFDALVTLTLRLGPDGLRCSTSDLPEEIDADLRGDVKPSSGSPFASAARRQLDRVVAELPPYALPSVPVTVRLPIAYGLER